MKKENKSLPKSALAIISLAWGIASFFPLIGILFGIVAIILGIAAIIQIKKKNLGGKNLAIWGISLGALGILFNIIFSYLFYILFRVLSEGVN